MTTLAAGSADGIYVLEADGVTIDDTGDVSVWQVNFNSTTTSVTTRLSDLRTADNGPITVVTTTGSLIVEQGNANPADLPGGVAAHGSGDVLLEARQVDVKLNADIVGSKITIKALDGLITIKDGAVLESTKGDGGKVNNVPIVPKNFERNPIGHTITSSDKVQTVSGQWGWENVERGMNFVVELVWSDNTSNSLPPPQVDAGGTFQLEAGQWSKPPGTDPDGRITLFLAHAYTDGFLFQLTDPVVTVDVTIRNFEHIRLEDSRSNENPNEGEEFFSLNQVTVTVETPVGHIDPPTEMPEGFAEPEPIVPEALPLAPPIPPTPPPRVVQAEYFERVVEAGGEEDRKLFLVKVNPDGTEETKIKELPEDVLANLVDLFRKFTEGDMPDGKYRIYLEEAGFPRRKLIEFLKSGDTIGDPVRQPGRGSDKMPEGDSYLPPKGAEVDELREVDGAWEEWTVPLVGAAALTGGGLAAGAVRDRWERRIDEALEASQQPSLGKAARLLRRLRR